MFGNACYAAVHNDQEKPIDAMDNGVFFLNSHLRYDDVTDGSAHTLYLGEKLPRRLGSLLDERHASHASQRRHAAECSQFRHGPPSAAKS